MFDINKVLYGVDEYKGKELLFRFIKPDENDMLSQMKAIDLEELLILLDNYFLEMRYDLGFDKGITFGLELEFEHTVKKTIERRLKKANLRQCWLIKGDNSLVRGIEINSPILRDKSMCWNELEKVCSIVDKKAIVGKNSSGHINVDSKILGGNPRSWLNFIKLWSVYENVIFRFSYGEFLNERCSLMTYASPISEFLWNDYCFFSECSTVSMQEIIYKVSHKREQAINFNKVQLPLSFDYESDNVIEFRCPNGTLEPVVWQNYVMFFINFLLYCNSINFNDDIVQKRRDINVNLYGDVGLNLELYRYIYLQQTLELSDMIFNKNIDKLYFLRQYLKSFDIGKKKMQRAKCFVKKA